LSEQVATELYHDLVKVYTPNDNQNTTEIENQNATERAQDTNDITAADPAQECSGGAGLVSIATGNEAADPTENGACESIQAKRDNMVLQFTSDGTVQPGPGFTAEFNCLNIAPTHPDDVVALAALAAANPDCTSCRRWAVENPCDLNHAMDGTLAKLGGRAGVRGLPKQDGTTTDENEILELYPDGELAPTSKSSMVISCRPEGEAELMPDGVRNDVCKYYKNEADEPRPNSLAWLSRDQKDVLYWWKDGDESPPTNDDGVSLCDSITEFERASTEDFSPVWKGMTFDDENTPEEFFTAQSHMQ